MAFLLRNDIHCTHKQQLWKMIPTLHIQAWHLLAVRSGLQNAVVPEFKDYTVQRERFTNLVNSGNINDFLGAMHDYAFPCVKCPFGCFAYVDECSCLPFNDFLAWKFNTVFCCGNCNKFKGVRHDWPSTSIQLNKFRVVPGLVVDKKYGCQFCSAQLMLDH